MLQDTTHLTADLKSINPRGYRSTSALRRVVRGSPDTEQRANDLVNRRHDIPHYALQDLEMASDGMNARYDRLANAAGFQEGDQV
jgi:hypothetical protein